MMLLEATDGAARAGRVLTARGEFLTPCFMPVGSRGVVRLLSARDLDELSPQVVLANTYHLMLRPGAEVVAAMGGLHGFTAWDGHFLTDSGGYQVMSLPCSVDDEGVTFRSAYDGSSQRLTPEGAVAVQELLGADIQMVLDVCTELPASRAALEVAGERTIAWAERARAAHLRPDQQLFGIVQGGTELDLREQYAWRTAEIGFDGYAVGGLSVGEARAELLGALSASVGPLPLDRPRYLMGVGDPATVIAAVARGVDMFDCVLPTRLARHGTALTALGKLSVKAAANSTSSSPLDPGCGCPVCTRHSRAYLRHLFNVGEPSAGRLVSLHNLMWLQDFMARVRQAIIGGRFEALRAEVDLVWPGDAGGQGAREGRQLAETPFRGPGEPLG